MSKYQRQKGASYERELCAVLSEATGNKIQRNIGQSRDGGNDITYGDFLFEAKRRKSLKTLEGWLKQAEDARTNPDQIPVVVARADGGESMVLMALKDFLHVTGLEHRNVSRVLQ